MVRKKIVREVRRGIMYRKKLSNAQQMGRAALHSIPT